MEFVELTEHEEEIWQRNGLMDGAYVIHWELSDEAFFLKSQLMIE